MSRGLLRRSANTTTPMASARTASAANAVRRSNELMSATAVFGMMMAATPDPTAATPATVATFARNQRLMRIVEAIMPPNPYPSPVSADAAHKSAKFAPANAYRANPALTHSVARNAPLRQSSRS